MSNVTIWHNPACGTSRNVLALIRASGAEPEVVEYLRTPPSRDAIAAAARRIGIPLRALLREKGTPFAELGLGDPSLSDAALLDAMVAHPILINRPVVFTPRGARLCRPSETVLDILPAPQRADLRRRMARWCRPGVVDLPRRLAAEALATALLLADRGGLGIMAERLAGGNVAVALLANALATGAMLPVLILAFGPVSGGADEPGRHRGAGVAPRDRAG
jgi:arsenate reductase